MLHFGGGKFDKTNQATDGYYGSSSPSGGGGIGAGTRDIGEAYRSRKQELEERIRHKKLMKAEKLKRKEDQVETFETMDESFAELAGLLQFRDKERERVERSEKRKKGMLDEEEMEMDAWDKEMKVNKSLYFTCSATLPLFYMFANIPLFFFVMAIHVFIFLGIPI
jgi:hypothetical protein